MRALTMDEVGFVSGGGTPLKQQQEQAARDAFQKSLQDLGMTPNQASFLMAYIGGLSAFVGEILAEATYIANYKTLSMAAKAIGISAGVAAAAIPMILEPSPAY